MADSQWTFCDYMRRVDYLAKLIRTMNNAIRAGDIQKVEEIILLQTDTDYFIKYALLSETVSTAIKCGQINIVRLLITKYNFPVDNVKSGDLETLLHIACAYGQVNVIRMLLTECKADLLKARNIRNDTPLHEAALKGQTDVIIYLINEFNCDPSTKGSCGRTILHHACCSNSRNVELAKKLLAHYKLNPFLADDEGNTPLHCAVIGGSTELVYLLITKYGVPVDCRNNYKQTPLHLACRYGCLKVVSMLLTDHKADLNARNEENNTPFYEAVLQRKITVIVYLINELNCDPNSKAGCGRTILHYACLENPIFYGNEFVELAIQLLTHNKIDPLLTDDDGNTSLHYAVKGGSEVLIDLLITQYGVPVDCRNNYKQTPLHFACRNGRVNSVRLLVTKYKADINACDKDSNMPLNEAFFGKHTEVISYLVNTLTCNLYVPEDIGYAILHHACESGHVELVTALLTHYHLDPLLTDDDGNTSLHYAVKGGSEELVDLLIIQYVVPVDCRNNCKQTPLHLACRNGHLNVVKSLLTKHNANLDTRNEDDNTPLHEAALHSEIDVIECLIKEFNYDPSTKGIGGKSILHLACKQEEPDVDLIEMLLEEFKLDPLSKDYIGNTALHDAASGGNEEIVELLIKDYKCPLNCKNKHEQTPLHLAAKNGHVKLYFTLINKLNADEFICDYNNQTPFHELFRLFLKHYNTEDANFDDSEESVVFFINTACFKGFTEVINVLLTKYRGHLFADNDGNTPLHHAAMGGKEEVVKILISRYNRDIQCRNRKKQTPLHLACLHNQVRIVRVLVTEYKAKLNVLDENSATPLDLAAKHNKLDVVKCLMTEYKCFPDTESSCQAMLISLCCNGPSDLVEMLLTNCSIDLQSADDYGLCPIHYAISGNKMDMIKLLITKFHCPVDCRESREQFTPLHMACARGRLDIVKTLIVDYKADLNLCYTSESVNTKPLHIAAMHGQTEVVKCLINEFNCDPNTKIGAGRNILHIACLMGHFELVKFLISHYHFDPKSVDIEGLTVLHACVLGPWFLSDKESRAQIHAEGHTNTGLHDPESACVECYVNIVKILVTEFKADLNASINNFTPLQIAAQCGVSEIVKCLVNDFCCDPNIKGPTGRSLLHLACKSGSTELVELLVTQYNLDLSLSSNKDGNKPLHDSAVLGQKEIVRLLISKFNCDVHSKNNDKNTPLHLASSEGHVDVVRMLVSEFKADVNCRNLKLNTPLHVAAFFGQSEIVKCLINEFNANIHLFGFNGQLIIHLACTGGHISLVKLLIDSFNISPIARDTRGNTPLHVAAKYGETKCAHMLLHDYHVPVNLVNESGKTALDVASSTVAQSMREVVQQVDWRSQFDYKTLQELSFRKYTGFQRLIRIFVVGNIEAGKSSLIESLKREGFISSLNKVTEATVPPHTSGIIPSTHISKSIGRVLYYDFAGDPEYYSSHSAIMTNLVQKAALGENVFFIVVNFCKKIEFVLEEIGYWFSFISYHIEESSECKILIIGSHADLIHTTEARRKKQLVADFIQQYLSQTPKVTYEVPDENILTLDCRRPKLSKNIKSLLSQKRTNLTAYCISGDGHILLGLLDRDLNDRITCKPQALVAHIKETGVYLLNMSVEKLYPLVIELEALGFLMLVKGSNSNSFEDSLLILNMQKLTNEVHKLLFSDDSTLSSTNPLSVSMGILTRKFLKRILPKQITIDCLIQLQYCQEFSHAEVKLDYSVVATKDSKADTLLYFPALCKNERKEVITSPSNFCCNISWYLKCVGKFDFLPPRFLHVLLLRLAYSFALPSAHTQTDDNDAEAVLHQYNRRCTMWKNGIHWLMEEGVECYVENVENSRGVIVVTRSEEIHKCVCTEMLVKIIKEIVQAKKEFCRTVTLQQFLVNSNDPMSDLNDENKLYLESDICRVLKEGKPYVLSVNGKQNLKTKYVSSLMKYVVYDTERNKYAIDLESEIAMPPTRVAETVAEDTSDECTEEKQIADCKLSEHHYMILSECLAEHSSKWEDIAYALGFRPSELNNIKAQPLLIVNAPKSWLTKMLAEWLQWAPGDARGSKRHATLVGLRDALTKVGLTETFKLIMTRLSAHE